MTPCGIRLKRSERVLELDWPQRATSRLAARELRCECRCAACVDEFTGARLLDPRTVPDDVGIQGVRPVGNYALALQFSDGHQTGLFTFEHLWELATR